MVEKRDIVDGLARVGLKAGDTVLVHSAMRTFGLINGGAPTVVGALREVLGQNGTLIVPTFTFKHEAAADPIIDPSRDRSEMGVITEEVRGLPGALRSIAYRHSFAAIGPNASAVTQVAPELSVFDLRSSFGKMLDLDTKVLIIGMTYESSTTHHFAEYLCGVPYRHTIPIVVSVRRPDGSLMRQPMTDYQPLPSEDGSYYSREPDFNKLGRILEERGLVGIAAIGNSIVRQFKMRGLIELARAEAAKDYNIFRADEGREQPTSLEDGNTVLSPPMLDGAGRPNRHLWCVVDPEGVFSRPRSHGA
jgi:aminoglycoside 3-N-acetyltransferase